MKNILIFCIALLCVSCASNVRYYPYVFQKEPARNIKSVAVAPLNLINKIPSEAGPKSSAVYDALKAYLTDNKIATQPAEKIAAIWKEEIQKAGGIFDPADGKLQPYKFNKCLRNMVTKVCDSQAVDAVVLTAIIRRPAIIENSVVYWDGAEQSIEFGKGDERPFADRVSGDSTALSLRVFIVNKDGRIILKNFAGLEFPYKVVLDKRTRSETKMELRKDLFTDEARIRQAVAISLHPFMLFSEYPKNPAFLKN